MDIKYKVVYTAKNGEKVESLFHSLNLAEEFASLMGGIVLNNKEV